MNQQDYIYVYFFLLLILAFSFLFDIDVCIYSTCTFVVVDCQADFDVDNVQRRELVHFYGV